MTKIIWKANQVISIETRRKDEKRKSNIYVLAQMVGKAELLIFDMFNTDNDWKEIDLKKNSYSLLYNCYKAIYKKQ